MYEYNKTPLWYGRSASRGGGFGCIRSKTRIDARPHRVGRRLSGMPAALLSVSSLAGTGMIRLASYGFWIKSLGNEICDWQLAAICLLLTQ